jgi:hypothetical protein
LRYLLALILLGTALAAQAREGTIAWLPQTHCEDRTTDLTACPVTGYRIETAASCTAIAWELLAITPVTTSYALTNIPAGPRCYRLKALSAAGPSLASDVSALPEVVVAVKRAAPPEGVTITITVQP